MKIDYISDCTELQSFPEFVFKPGLTEYTILYHVITDRENRRRFNRNEFVSWKLGQHCVAIPLENRDKFIIDKTASRAKSSSKAIDFYFNVHDIIIPGHHSQKIDDIFREKLHPAVSRIIDPYYNSYYTWRQLKKLVESGTASKEDIEMFNTSGNPTELAYHISKKEFDIINMLVYEFIYGISIEKLDELYKKVKSDKDVVNVMNYLKDLTDNAQDSNKERQKKYKEAHTNAKKDFFMERHAYRKLLFDDRITSTDSCAIFSSAVTDAVNCLEIYVEKTRNITVYCMEPDIKEDVIERLKFFDYPNDVVVKELWVHNDDERYDYVVMHIPNAGNFGNKVLATILQKYVKKTGTAKILTDSSLVHTYVVHRHMLDEYDNETIEDAVIGEKTSYQYIDQIHKMLDGHIRDVSLENTNQFTKTQACISFLSITADFGKRYETFDFCCHGIYRKEKSLRNCIEFGTPTLFKRIIEKLWNRFGMVRILSDAGNKPKVIYPYFLSAPQKNYIKNRRSISSERTIDGIKSWFFSPLYEMNNSEITDRNINPRYIVADTVEEIENYKKNCHLSIMKYVGIMLSCVNARTNIYKDLIPFVADKSYTDDEIFDKLELTRAEKKEIMEVNEAAKSSDEMIKNMEFGINYVF